MPVKVTSPRPWLTIGQPRLFLGGHHPEVRVMSALTARLPDAAWFHRHRAKFAGFLCGAALQLVAMGLIQAIWSGVSPIRSWPHPRSTSSTEHFPSTNILGGTGGADAPPALRLRRSIHADPRMPLLRRDGRETELAPATKRISSASARAPPTTNSRPTCSPARTPRRPFRALASCLWLRQMVPRRPLHRHARGVRHLSRAGLRPAAAHHRRDQGRRPGWEGEP